jgi:hypothetical protein
VRRAGRGVAVRVVASLVADLRERAIRLMAQLAFNIVEAQPNSPIKESDYGTSPEHTQDST